MCAKRVSSKKEIKVDTTSYSGPFGQMFGGLRSPVRIAWVFGSAGDPCPLCESKLLSAEGWMGGFIISHYNRLRLPRFL